jgi:hypothetical protein
MVRKEAILFGIVAWIILIILFIEDKTATDGITLVGFPWYFYSYANGQLAYVNQSQLGFNLSNLVVDLSALAIFVYMVNIFLERSLKKSKPDKPTYL